jgi:uncharacterized protein YoxC
MEAEEDREADALAELGLDEPTEETDEVEDAEIEETDETLENIEGDIDAIDNEESDKLVDDIVEINCQINAKMISNLFDQIAELKTKVEGLGLDEGSREYLKYDVSIQYYSDKLQDLQNKTNPGIDQTKVETAIEKISNAIKELTGEMSGDSDESFDVDSPEEVEANAELKTEDETEELADLDEKEAEETEVETDEVETETQDGETEVTDDVDDEDLDDLFG